MLVKEIMTPKIESITPGLSLKEAAQKMRDLHIGSLAVWEDGGLVGIITDRDICCRAIANGLDPLRTTVRAIMTQQVAFCFGDDEIASAAHMMESRQLRRLAVLDHNKAMVGFLSVHDLARYSHHLAGEVLEAATPLH